MHCKGHYPFTPRYKYKFRHPTNHCGVWSFEARNCDRRRHQTRRCLLWIRMDSNHKTVNMWILKLGTGIIYIPPKGGKRKFQDSKFAFWEDVLVLKENMLTLFSWWSHHGRLSGIWTNHGTEKSRNMANHRFWGPQISGTSIIFDLSSTPKKPSHFPSKKPSARSQPFINLIKFRYLQSSNKNIPWQSVTWMFQLPTKHHVLWTKNILYPIPALNFFVVLQISTHKPSSLPSKKEKLDQHLPQSCVA